MATLGQAFIEVHADTKPFAKELKRSIDKIIKSVDATIGVEGVQVGAELGKGISRGLDKETDRSLLSWRQKFSTFAKDIGNEGAKAFTAAFHRLATGNFILFRVIGNLGERLIAVSKALKKISGLVFDVATAFGKVLYQGVQLAVEGIKSLLGFANDFSKVASSAGAAAANLGSAIATLAANASTAAAGLIAAVVAGVALVGVMSALAAVLIVAAAPFATLLNFALLLPGALSVLVAIVAPLVIAMHNLGDALKLVFESDPKKLADGLAKLSPVLRGLVTSLRSVAPLLQGIRDSVQRAFFNPILRVLAPTIRSIAPILRQGLTQAATALGTFVGQALALLNSPAFRRFLTDLFPAVSRIIQTLSTPLLHLLNALGTAAGASLPTVEGLVTKIGQFIERFATWIETTVADGRFQKFLDDAVASAKSIWSLIWSLIGVFGQLFTQTDEGGRKFLDKITQAVNKFSEWLKSPEGKRALQEAVILALAFAAAFGVALKTIQKIVGLLSVAIGAGLVLLNLIAGNKKAVEGGVTKTSTQLKGYSGGGVVGYDQLAVVHKGEPILDPANSPGRNRGILAEAGMLDLLNRPQVINVYVGGRVLQEMTDYQIQRANTATGRALKQGPRSA